MACSCLVPILGGKVSPVGPVDSEHPLLVEAKKQLLGTTNKTTLEQDLLDLYSQIDIDRSGTLELEEVVIFFKAITDDISLENVNRIFKEIDENKSNDIDFQEFKKLFHQITVAGWKKVQVINREEIAEAELRYCFDLIDKNKTGHITLDDSMKASKLLGNRFNIFGVENWMKVADVDEKGYLTFDEFKKSLKLPTESNSNGI